MNLQFGWPNIEFEWERFNFISLYNCPYTWRIRECDIVENKRRILKSQPLQPVLGPIQNLIIPSSDISYTWEWNANKNGDFTFASCWDLVRTPEPVFPLADIVWFKSHSPMMAIFLLRALHSKLLTMDFRKKLGIAEVDRCVICKISKESTQHLFFQCPFSAYL